ncbi:MAG: flavodoxin family protein, partial [Candidatus Bipolaricaulia bacterium]
MKILALQGSPRGRAGVTDRVLKEFLSGAEAAGAECETIYLAQKKILPCTGEFHCWAVTPGRCINAEKDDVASIHELMKRADSWVFATPIYVDSMTGQMKTFLDRSLPLLQPYFRLTEEGECYHPLREIAPGKRIVLVAVNGFYEWSHFEPLVLTFRRITRNLQGEWAGAVLRPHG